MMEERNIPIWGNLRNSQFHINHLLLPCRVVVAVLFLLQIPEGADAVGFLDAENFRHILILVIVDSTVIRRGAIRSIQQGITIHNYSGKQSILQGRKLFYLMLRATRGGLPLIV